MPSQPPVSSKPSLTIKCRIDAPPEKIFRAWTQAEKITRWFGPGEWKCCMRKPMRAPAVATICISSASSAAAMTTIPGRFRGSKRRKSRRGSDHRRQRGLPGRWRSAPASSELPRHGRPDRSRAGGRSKSIAQNGLKPSVARGAVAHAWGVFLFVEKTDQPRHDRTDFG